MKKTFEKRWYQDEAFSAIYRDIAKYNPIIAVPTGGGKTVIIAKFIHKFLGKYPHARILVIASTKEIIQQDYITLQSFIDKRISIYSAGLKQKNISQITIAGIQSIYKKPDEFDKFNIIIVDECHEVPFNKNSMYRKFFDGIQRNDIIKKYVGLSATIFRTGKGYLHKGKNALFNKISYDLTSFENFNRLIEEGYLCNLISKPAKTQLSVEGARTTAYDFNKKDLSVLNDRDIVTKAAVQELIQIGKDRKSWLVFAIDIKHANHIFTELSLNGIVADVLHSGTNDRRDSIIKNFKSFKIQALVSVNMVTTGFDAPNIDLIGVLSPSKSIVRHVQMTGRGLRPYSGKENCLVLDFSGNIDRLGPINDIIIQNPKKKKKNTPPPMKICPNCGFYQFSSVRKCTICANEFEFENKLTHSADSKNDIILRKKEKKTEWLKVDKVHYSIHKKAGSPNSFKISYFCGLSIVNKYVCIEHNKQFVKRQAVLWLKRHGWKGEIIPTVKEIFEKRYIFPKPKKIKITNEKFPDILKYKF